MQALLGELAHDQSMFRLRVGKTGNGNICFGDGRSEGEAKEGKDE